MLRILRRSNRLVAPFAVAIAAMVLIGTVDWWHADDEDGAAPVFHNHAAHRLRSEPAAKHTPEHCYLCHWLRTLGNGLGSAAAHRLTSVDERQVFEASNRRACDLFIALLSARAPPV